MEEVSAAELRRLRRLEERIVSTNDTLADVRVARDAARNDAKALRATGREKDKEIRDLKRQVEQLEKQVSGMVDENGSLSSVLADLEADQARVIERAEALVAENAALTAARDSLSQDFSAAEVTLGELTADRNRLSKQLDQAIAQIEGDEAPEIQPDQLSAVLSDFVAGIGAQTGLRNVGTELNLKVGFTGRNGGGFVVPSAGSDRDKFPELHNVKIELAPVVVERDV